MYIYISKRIRISVFSVLWLIFIITSSCFENIYPIISAIVLHEGGHIVAIKAVKSEIELISVLPFGMDIKLKKGSLTYKNDIIIASGGIISNIVFFIFSSMIYIMKGYDSALLFAISNILYFIINAIPIQSLDGGRIVYSYILIKKDIVFADKVRKILSFIFIVIMWSCGIYFLFYTTWNFSLFVLCVYLFFSCCQKE